MQNKGKLIFFIITLMILLFPSSVEASQNQYNFSLSYEETYSESYKKIEYINQDLAILINQDSFEIKIDKETLLIEDKYKNYSYINNELYILTINKLYLINLDLLSYSYTDIEMNCNDFLISDYIYIVGSAVDKPTIIILDKNYNKQKIKSYQGEGYAAFTNVFIIDDTIVLLGEKDAYYNNDIFLNVGNKNDLKSFILTMDKTLKEKNIYHFNENRPIEKIVSYEFQTTIDIILQSSTKSYYYSFDLDLNLVDYFLLDSNANNLGLVKTNKEKLFIMSNEESFKILLLEENRLKEIFSLNKSLINYNQVDGGICFNINDNGIKTLIYSEYHILKKDDLVLSRLDYNLDSQDHFLVESFFENLNFSIDVITPYHQYMKSGNYEITYVALNHFNANIYITTKLKVLDYVNIINNGIYNVNTKLLFFGDAYLNNNTINNGYILKDPGEYELLIKNINQEELVYHFTVIDDYYKDNDNILLDYDYLVNILEPLKINLKISTNKKVKEILVNSEKVSFEQDCDNIFVSLYFDTWGYKQINIEEILFEDDECIKINQKFIILVKKQMPIFNVCIDNENNYSFNIDISAPDLSILDLVFKNAEGEIKTFLKEQNLKLNDVDCYIQYELGEGIIYEEKIFCLVGNNVTCHVFTKQNESNELNINVSFDNDNNIKEIRVLEQNLYKKEEGDNNFLIIFITIISSLIVLISFLIIIIIIKVRNRKLIKFK